MSEQAPTVYLLHGEDSYAMRQFVSAKAGTVNHGIGC